MMRPSSGTLMKNNNNIGNRVAVVRDGSEGLDFLVCTGAYAGRDPHKSPQFILLDLKVPKVDGLKIPRCLYADEHTRWLPVAIRMSFNEEQDLIEGYMKGANSYIRTPVDFNQFLEAVRQLGRYWLELNESPPG